MAIPTLTGRSLVLAARLAATGAIAVGAMMLTAPAGNAIPESEIVSECDAANGGTYTTTLNDGKRYSKCCYRDIDGNKECDNYVDGVYTNTTVNSTVEPSPPSPPPPPPGGEVVGPPATVATQTPRPPPPGAVGPPATVATQAPAPPEGMILWPGYAQTSPGGAVLAP
ncbi:hypothetical protein [Mycolicibacterium hippocampi]|uniref:Uncharacterized protein n=1 Tax=Mycolicibacterium hippocampi TaxID=659824 RepID=A0A7I9ZN15_9MYCO|nr:hypothetical protein [Mycolicibacterium hippocampi]GFH02422.1 hypothetical protein MHIP_29050 [Mycolicibacterium hippocampi]